MNTKYLTVKEALNLLLIHTENKKQRVHTFDGCGMGCNVDLSVIKKRLQSAKNFDDIVLSSGVNTMGHRVALYFNDGWLFISSDDKKVKEFEKSLDK